MSDNTERIVVEVDGSNASSGFGRIKTDAQAADAAIDKLGNTVDSTQNKLNSFGGSGQKAASGLNEIGNAGTRAKEGIDKASDAAERGQSKFDALQSALFSVKGKAVFIWDMAADGMRMAIGFADQFIDKISSVQRTMSLLSAIPGTNIGEQFTYLTETANKFGLSLDQLQTNYARFVLSAQNSSMSNEQVRRSFEQIALTVRTLHMNTQQAQFTFLALEEMMSKGQISMQQLNRQFSIRIPGAMEAIAHEIGVTTPVLVEFITKVGAASDKMMPQITNALQRMFVGGIQNAAQALDAERNRLSTSVTLFFKNVLDSGGAEGMSTLLKTVNGLLQTETVAQIFATAMNTITGSITSFLRELKPGDIDKFAKTALDFLSAFTVLALAAGKAVVFVSQHIPEVGAAIGAFVGATALAPLGPWGAAIGLIGGGALGYMGAKSLGGNSQGELQEQTAKYNDLSAQMSVLQNKIDHPVKFLGMSFDPSAGGNAVDLKRLKAQRDAMEGDLDRLRSNAVADQSPSYLDVPDLGEPAKALTGTMAQQLKQLTALFGSKTGKKTAEERLAERQNNFLEGIVAQLQSVQDPEAEKFNRMAAEAKKLGISMDRPFTSSSGASYSTVQQIFDTFQSEYNAKKQGVSDQKTSGIERQFAEMENATKAEKDKFSEKYSIANLMEVDDQSWQVKARKMGSELESSLIEEQKKIQDRINLNPLELMKHSDIAGEIDAMRAQGQAYIDEFKRIEAEKRSVMGGTKAFLKDWNESAQNFGKITQDFLKGVTDGIVDMLTDMVMHGRLSFSKLTEFVLGYITKMMIVQSITPFMNTFAGAISGGLASILSVGSGAGGAAQLMFNGQNLMARASGGDVTSGQPYLVGERGPEIVTFDRAGYVHPNSSLQTGGGGNVSVNVNVDASGQTTSQGPNSMAQLGRKIGDAVRAVLVDEKRPGGMLA